MPVGFIYPTAVSTGYSSLASYWAQRMTSVTGSSGFAADGMAPTGIDGWMQAMADGVMGTVGFQSQSDAAGLGTATNATAVFAAVGNGSSTGFTTWSFSAPTSKVYQVAVDLSCYMATASDMVHFRLMKDGSTVFDSPAARFLFNSTGVHHRISFRCPVAMVAGANVLSLDWKVLNAVGTATVDTSDFRCFTVMG